MLPPLIAVLLATAWADIMAWCTANQNLLITLAVLLLPTVTTALTKYPQAAGLVSVLKIVLDRLSLAQHRDSPGVVSAPFARSTPPENVVPLTIADAMKKQDPPPLGYATVRALLIVVMVTLALALVLITVACGGAL